MSLSVGIVECEVCSSRVVEIKNKKACATFLGP